MLIGIVNYGLGNVKSVSSAFEYLGYDTILCKEKNDFSNITHLVLPGVGAFERAMNLIKNKKLYEVISNKVNIEKTPTLGICLGLQIMADKSYEFGEHTGFSWIQGKVIKLPTINKKSKLPNIGWESVSFNDKSLFKGISQESDFYFVHSFYLKPSNKKYCIGTYKYGNENITAAIRKENIVATQFHPEKSQENGLKFLENFIKLY